MIKFFLFISCSLPLLVFANIIDVGQGYPYPTIQAALIEARNGDQIRIHPGKYNEYDLVIGVPLTITGIGWPVIDGMSKGEIMSIKSDSVFVSGLVLRNTGRSSTKDFAAVRVYSASHVNISGNRVEDAFFGIYLENSSRCVIHDNQVQSSVMTEQMLGNGIHCWKCDSLEIGCNTLSNHRDGIYFEFVTNSSIRSNYSFSNMRYGLHFMFSHNDVYEGNVFESNGAGVAVMYTKEVKMISNQFVENWGASSYGLLLKDISHSIIEKNLFSDNTTGIYMEGTNDIRSSENDFVGNGYALRIQANCYDGEFNRNNFCFNSFDIATNGTRILNSFDGNYWDKYEGYDLNRDGVGDVPYHPVSLYSMVVERMPNAMMLYRSFIVSIMDKAERVMPAITPVDLSDKSPLMKATTW